MPETFSCPTCGAPLNYKAGDGETVTCPYCHSSVIVPAELRNARPDVIPPDRSQGETLIPQIRALLSRNQKIEAIKLVRQNFPVGLKEAKDAVDEIEAGTRDSLADLGSAASSGSVIQLDQGAPNRRAGPTIITVVVGMAIFMIGAVAIFFFMQQAPPPVNPTEEAPTATAAPTPTLVPTPQFATLVSTLGSEGIGAGKFSQANSLAIDPQGNLYVGDYVGNRVQVFDPAGKFIVQWTLEPTLHIRHMVAGLNGEIYVNMSGQIFVYDSKTGKQTGEVKYTDPKDGDIDDFDEMAVGLDGNLLVTWINNTQETDTLLRFDSSGKVIQTIEGPIQAQVGDFDPEIYLALDGLGNIFVLGGFSDTICEYNPQGKLINRFGSKGPLPGQIDNADNIAVDSQGRLYLGQFEKVQVFDATGRYLDAFDTDGEAHTMAFDRQDNLFLQDATKVTRYTLRKQ